MPELSRQFGEAERLTTVQRLSPRGWIGMLAIAGAVSALAMTLTASFTDVAAPIPSLVIGFISCTLVAWAEAWCLVRMVPKLSVVKWMLFSVAVGTPFGLVIMPNVNRPWPLAVMLTVSMGLVSGSAMGWVQALLLGRQVPNPHRWVFASAFAWAFGMAIVIGPAAALGDSWWAMPTSAVCGAIGGALIGVTAFMVTPLIAVSGPRALTRRERVINDILRGPAHGLISENLAELRFQDVRSGKACSVPVHHAPLSRSGTVRAEIVLVTSPSTQTWFRSMYDGAPVTALLDEALWVGVVSRVARRDQRFGNVWDAYLAAHPRAELGPFDCLLLLDLRTG